MPAFRIEKIFTDEEIADIILLFHASKAELMHQDYNLFDVDKRQIQNRSEIPVLQKIDRFIGLSQESHYFVMYKEEAFTALHIDHDDVVKMTAVTLLEEKDLVGGETIFLERYQKKSRPSDRGARRGKGGRAPVGVSKIPMVAKLKVGETIMYDSRVTHGVAQVESGQRLVLVSWYK